MSGEVLLKGRLRAALLRLNDWLTEGQAGRVIFELENVNATGMARNQVVHEYLTYGMPLTVDRPRERHPHIKWGRLLGHERSADRAQEVMNSVYLGKKKWAWMDSNHRPRSYQDRALTA